MKCAIELFMSIDAEGKIEISSHTLTGDHLAIDDMVDIHFDFKPMLEDLEQVQKLKAEPGEYQLFSYGEISEEYGEYETGREFDGWIIEPLHVHIDRVPEYIQDEQEPCKHEHGFYIQKTCARCGGQISNEKTEAQI